MKYLLPIPMVISALMLTGCDETKTIEYYDNHLDEAKTVYEECKKKTSTLSENCKNAKKALANDFRKQLFNN